MSKRNPLCRRRRLGINPTKTRGVALHTKTTTQSHTTLIPAAFVSFSIFPAFSQDVGERLTEYNLPGVVFCVTRSFRPVNGRLCHCLTAKMLLYAYYFLPISRLSAPAWRACWLLVDVIYCFQYLLTYIRTLPCPFFLLLDTASG